MCVCRKNPGVTWLALQKERAWCDQRLSVTAGGLWHLRSGARGRGSRLSRCVCAQPVIHFTLSRGSKKSAEVALLLLVSIV